jgi:hypothetical protein
MNLEECSCYEDGTAEQYEATQFSASGRGDGYYTTIDSSLTTSKGSNKDLTFTSRILGTPGDDISVESLVAGNNTPLTISVATHKITIHSATDAGGLATSKAYEIRDALEASAEAMTLIKVKLATGSNGTGIFGAYTETNLAGGVDYDTGIKASLTTANGSNKDLKFVAQDYGNDGNDITVECIVSGSETPLTIDVVGDAITINSETNVGGDAISTAQEIMDALNGDGDAFALIETQPAPGSDCSGIFGAFTEDNLAGGVDDTDPDRWSRDIIGVFYHDSGASLIRTEGIITLEKVTLKAAKKDLVGKSISFRFQGLPYDHSG